MQVNLNAVRERLPRDSDDKLFQYFDRALETLVSVGVDSLSLTEGVRLRHLVQQVIDEREARFAELKEWRPLDVPLPDDEAIARLIHERFGALAGHDLPRMDCWLSNRELKKYLPVLLQRWRGEQELG